jgi:hypothetical protein
MATEGFQLSDIVSKYSFFLHYKGNYKENLSLKIVDIVDANLSLYFKKFIVNRLTYMVVETVQNIERYSASGGSSDDFTFIFSNHDYFHVITQNRIANKDIEGLKSRLDIVNSKNQEELKSIYLEALSSGEKTEKGAGLGLIDLARKSKNTLGYEFTQVSEDYSDYRLHVKIPILDDNVEVSSNDEVTELLQHFDAMFKNNKNTLFYSGDFSNAFLQSLLSMLNNLKRSDSLPATSIFKYTLIEFNENSKRHGTKIDGRIPGFLCLEWQADKSFLSTYNFITHVNAKELENKLTLLNSLTLEELKVEGQDFMIDFSLKGGLDLNDIARLNWPNKIEYSFKDDPDYEKSVFMKIQFDYR